MTAVLEFVPMEEHGWVSAHTPWNFNHSSGVYDFQNGANSSFRGGLAFTSDDLQELSGEMPMFGHPAAGSCIQPFPSPTPTAYPITSYQPWAEETFPRTDAIVLERSAPGYPEQYGHLTPPDTLSPPARSPEPISPLVHGNSESEVHPKMEYEYREMARVQRQLPQSNSKSKNSRKGSRKKSDTDPDEERKKFLERNRMAVSKSRAKKKDDARKAQERAKVLESERGALRAQVTALKNEVLELKQELLRHAECNCASIRSYIQRLASNLTASPTTPHQEPHEMYANAGGEMSPPAGTPITRRSSAQSQIMEQNGW